MSVSRTDLHTLGIIHADLKPDNIAIKCSATVSLRYFDPVDGFRHCVCCSWYSLDRYNYILICPLQNRLVSTQLCILDLGGALEERDDGNEGIVGAVNYRAPEISLGKCVQYASVSMVLTCHTRAAVRSFCGHFCRGMCPGGTSSGTRIVSPRYRQRA